MVIIFLNTASLIINVRWAIRNGGEKPIQGDLSLICAGLNLVCVIIGIVDHLK